MPSDFNHVLGLVQTWCREMGRPAVSAEVLHRLWRSRDGFLADARLLVGPDDYPLAYLERSRNGDFYYFDLPSVVEQNAIRSLVISAVESRPESAGSVHIAPFSETAVREFARLGYMVETEMTHMTRGLGSYLAVNPASSPAVETCAFLDSDARDVFDLVQDAFASEQYTRREYMSWLSTAQGIAFEPSLWRVAKCDGRMVGIALGRKIGVDAEVTHIAVAAGFRGQRIGTVLMYDLLSRMAMAACQMVWLQYREPNPCAAALYARMGFLKSGALLILRKGAS